MSLKEIGQFAWETYLPVADLALPALGAYLIFTKHPIEGTFAVGAGALVVNSEYRKWKRHKDELPSKDLSEPQEIA